MASFSFGLLVIVVITICILAFVKRYVYPIKANRWRNSTGLSRTLANLYDWMDGKGTVTRKRCKEYITDDSTEYRDDE